MFFSSCNPNNTNKMLTKKVTLLTILTIWFNKFDGINSINYRSLYNRRNTMDIEKISSKELFCATSQILICVVGLCFNPLRLICPPCLCTLFLLFRGDTNLAASRDGENDCLSLEAVSLDGENDRRSLEEVAGFFGDCCLLKLTRGLVGDRVITTGGLLIFTWNFEAEAGDLIKNLCGVCCLFLVITGDFVLQNFGGWELSDGRNKAFGKSTAFFDHGLFQGDDDTRFARYCAFSLSTTSLLVGGDTTLKLIRDRTRWSEGECDSVRFDWNFSCFSLFLLALSSESSRFGLRFLCRVNGVFGSSIVVFLVVLLVTASTISLANLLACSISPMVSSTSIAGKDIFCHSPVKIPKVKTYLDIYF